MSLHTKIHVPESRFAMLGVMTRCRFHVFSIAGGLMLFLFWLYGTLSWLCVVDSRMSEAERMLPAGTYKLRVELCHDEVVVLNPANSDAATPNNIGDLMRGRVRKWLIVLPVGASPEDVRNAHKCSEVYDVVVASE